MYVCWGEVVLGGGIRPNSLIKILCISGLFLCIPKLVAGCFFSLKQIGETEEQEGQLGSLLETDTWYIVPICQGGLLYEFPGVAIIK